MFVIATGTPTHDINTLIASAPAGSIIEFAAGQHEITETIVLNRSDIWLRGSADGETELIGLTSANVSSLITVGEGREFTVGAVAQTVSQGDTSISVPNNKVAEGDMLRIWQPDVSAFVADPEFANVDPDYAADRPFLEYFSEVVSVSGDVIELQDPVPYDMGSNVQVRAVDAVERVRISDLAITFDLGTADPFAFENTQPDLLRSAAIHLHGTNNVELADIDVRDAPSLSFLFEETIHLTGERLSADGAHNKGTAGNGYGIEINEGHHITLTELQMTDLRHAVLLSAWHSETNNYIHISEANRDVNFHGGVDVGNTFIVDRLVASYREGEQAWPIVSPGGDHHPPTDIYGQNEVYFRYVVAADRRDELYGHADGSFLAGMGREDTLIGNVGQDSLFGGTHDDTLDGGAGADLIVGDAGNDTLIGGEGADRFLFLLESGNDRILDFNPEEDEIEIWNSASGLTSEVLEIIETTSGSDLTLLTGEGVVSTIRLDGVSADALRPAIALRRDADFTVDLSLTSGADRVFGSGTAERVSAFVSTLGAEDTVDLGSGDDVLHVASASSTFDLTGMGALDGIDRIDMRDVSRIRLILDDNVVSGSDRGQLLLETGSAGIERLDLAAVDSAYRISVAGLGDVHLANADGQRLYLTEAFDGRFFGGSGDDYIALQGGAAAHGGRGVDTFSIRSTAFGNVFGDDGDDKLIIHDASGRQMTRVDGGTGYDRAVFFQADVSLADLAAFENVEDVEVRAADASVQIDAAMLARQGDQVTLDGWGDTLDVAGQTGTRGLVALDGAADVRFTGGAQRIELLDSFTGLLDAGDGDDLIFSGDADDQIMTGEGADTIIFVDGSGNDVLSDFDPARDTLVLRDVVNARSRATVELTQVGSDVVVSAGQNDVTVFGTTTDALRQAINVERSAGLTWEAQLTAGTDRVFGDSGNDVVSTYGSALTSDDWIDLGGGKDRLEILSRPYFRLDWRGFDKVDGIDVVSLDGMDWAELQLDDAVLSGTDDGVLRIETGGADLRLLDLSGVSEAYKVELSQAGDVLLADGGQSVFLNPDFAGSVTGGAGDDTIVVRGTSANIHTGGGNDLVKLSDSTQLNVTLGAGNDTIDAGNGSILAGSQISGGSGQDRLILRSQSQVDLADISLDGIEEIELRRNFTVVTLPELSDRIVFEGNGSSSAQLGTDSSARTEIGIGSGFGTVVFDDSDQIISVEGGGTLDVRAGGGRDDILGSGGADIVDAGEGDDEITGRGGDDRITTGSGSDTIRYREGDGDDIIYDFDPQTDRLILTDLLSAADTSDLEWRNDGNGTVLNLQGSDGVATLLLRDVQIDALLPAIEVVRTANFRLEVDLTAGHDNFVGGDGDDVVSTFVSNFGHLDSVALGSGEDTLRLLSSTYTLDLSNATLISGLDVVDLTGASTVRVTLDQHVVSNSDNGSLVLLTGPAGIDRLDTANVDFLGVPITSGPGDVSLSDSSGNHLLHRGSGALDGGRGNDVVVLAGEASIAGMGRGDDVVAIVGPSRDVQASLGDGADILVFDTTDMTAVLLDFDASQDRIALTAQARASFDGSALEESLGVTGSMPEWIVEWESLESASLTPDAHGWITSLL
ncbi:MAG: calcium-binding protein [Pseudomonadota bacterium]